jgi:serine/threonine protein kinase
MAPEVVSEEFGEVGPASDLYSLGFAAYELLAGEHFEELFPGLNATAPARTLAISVDAEVPAGTYPIVISGYNGPTKVTLTVQVTVNNVAELIFLPLVVR